ncbi:MAG: cobyrinate a,c-diamide synthase [Thermodesulfobacteriota bacterium]
MSRGLVIAGANSGCGKTTVALALMAWFGRQGKSVVPFKVGPDFIDPGHHARITGRCSTNLDGWMLSRKENQRLFAEHSAKGDLAIVEGVMGLFDGYDGKSEAGSSAQMAKWLDLPVILVVNAKSMARSAAALVQGYENFDPDLEFAGVIFNNLGSRGHLRYLREALEDNVRMPCLGGILRNQDLSIPERHLGLYTAEDFVSGRDEVQTLAGVIEQSLDTNELLRLIKGPLTARGPGGDRGGASEVVPAAGQGQSRPDGKLSGQQTLRYRAQTKVRLAVARDRAFCFYYQENLERLKQAGAEIVFFSPLQDESLPEAVQGIYLGGGYPELYAGDLAANRRLLSVIREKSRQGLPIYAECGGFMYLCQELVTAGGAAHELCGCFPFSCRMLSRLKALGYREVTLEAESILGPAGEKIRGHEFHYSELTTDSGPGVYLVSSRKGGDRAREGFVVDKTLGSYIHLHFGSNPGVAWHFVHSCLQQGRSEE